MGETGVTPQIRLTLSTGMTYSPRVPYRTGMVNSL